jgi:hypothetical protein
MKKIARMLMFVALLTLGTTTTLTSCDENQMEDFVESVNIIGTWSCTESVIPTTNPSANRYHYNGLITFRANHSFTDSYGDTGTWSIKNRMITLVYDNGLIRNVQFLIQDGYTSQTMVLTTTLNMAHGDTCLCSVVLRNVKR